MIYRVDASGIGNRVELLRWSQVAGYAWEPEAKVSQHVYFDTRVRSAQVAKMWMLPGHYAEITSDAFVDQLIHGIFEYWKFLEPRNIERCQKLLIGYLVALQEDARAADQFSADLEMCQEKLRQRSLDILSVSTDLYRVRSALTTASERLYERQNEVNRLTEELQSAREENQKLRDSLHWAEHKIGGNVEEFG